MVGLHNQLQIDLNKHTVCLCPRSNKHTDCTQVTKDRIPNPERTLRMRSALIAAARVCFATQGYAATGTPEIVAAAKVTRGALYHHFIDKAALFRAVVEAEQAVVMGQIEAGASDVDPLDALVAGGEAFLDAMDDAGRQRILLIDAPAFLGRDILDEIDAAAGNKVLQDGIEAAIVAGQIEAVDAATLAALMNALYDRAALSIAAAGDRDSRAQRRSSNAAVIRRIWQGLRVDRND